MSAGGPAARRSGWLHLRTTVIDRVVALALVPLIAPVVALLAGIVRLRDGAPVLIGLDRSGRGGRVFRMWKLRTMRVAAADGSAGGAVITAGIDLRVTPFGHWLRSWRLDELPQVINVIMGDMALLGPRPETPSLVDPADPEWAAVLAVRPGITGPTQLVVERWEAAVLEEGDPVARYRDEILPVKLAVDRWYVERSTPLVDLGVAWSMIERFVLGRHGTWVQRRVRRDVPAAAVVPTVADR